jgi:hypothetical protein
MPQTHSDVPRLLSRTGSGIGDERFRLIRAAFKHAQRAFHDGQYLETITILESILTDRMGSLVHGSLGCEVTLRHTLGGLITLAKKNVVVARPRTEVLAGRSRRRALPEDVIRFINTHVSEWWALRNHAVHGMAKLRVQSDEPFLMRYGKLRQVSLLGFVVLLQLDAYDQRERKANGAGRAATWPDALAVDRRLERLLFDLSAPT